MRLLTAIISVMLLCVALPQAAAEEFDLTQGTVLAIVGDKVLTTLDLAQRLQGVALDPSLTGDDRKAAKDKLVSEALDSLIDSELIYLDFKDRKGKIPPNYLQGRIDRIVVSQANGDEEKFRDYLHASNMTYKDFVEQVTKMVAVEMLTYDRTRRYVAVNDDQVRDYFYAHSNDFTSPDSYRLQVIMLRHDGRYAGKISATAGEIISKYSDGADFATLAKEYSEGMNPEEGGDLGWRTELAPALQTVAEQLAVGELYGGMLNIGNATYLVRLAEKKDGRRPELNAETEKEIRAIILEQIAKKKYDEYIRKLYMKFPVRRFDAAQTAQTGK